MIRAALSAALLAGCAMGPSEETLIDELRVVGAVAEPPEIGPGETTTLQITVADPLGEGHVALVWACTPTGAGCAEDALPLGERAAVLEDGEDLATLTAPAALARLIPDDVTVLPAQVQVLACAPDLCDVIDAVAAADPAAPADPDLAARLADPFGLLRELPLTGVSLATRTLGVSLRPSELRNQNPVITLDAPLPAQLDPEAPVDLPVSVSDDTTEDAFAFGFSTGGGFGAPFFAVIGGLANLTWYAPDVEGEVDLYVVVEDGEGGSALLRARATVGGEAGR